MATEILRPNAGGTYTGLCYFDGAYHAGDVDKNYQQVDEVVPDDLSTYVYNPCLFPEDHEDTYNLPAHVGGGIIHHVKVYSRVRARWFIESGKCKIAIYTQAALHYGPEVAIDRNWLDITMQWNTNPATGNPWTLAEIDALEIGMWFINDVGSTEVLCTQLYVEVDYTPVLAKPGLGFGMRELEALSAQG